MSKDEMILLFQSMMSAFDNNSLSPDQDTNRFLV